MLLLARYARSAAITNSGDKHFKKMHFMNLTFRMPVNLNFQKYNR